ncbi:hypothetical protein N7470_008120 [Penicillium chermesinum]|nr:hypothetical protein N7470_008120 [Penicillium chermesinum]
MANFQHPFLCLRPVKRAPDAWPSTNLDSTKASASGAAELLSDNGPPEKRRKLSDDANVDTQVDQEEKAQKKQSGSTDDKLQWSEIPIVTITSDGQYVVAVTLEDKTLRVFELSHGGKLQESKPRVMPKRLAAVTFTPDEQTLLCGDKHGDVYSMPLIPGDYIKSRIDETRKSLAATELTVHSGRNLRSLEQQKLQKDNPLKGGAPSQEERNVLNFEHRSILGHVSVLTDLISVAVSGRNYILTADRDEHIRVSRGYPQAHVIEQFCLGHKSFVSKIVAPAWAPELLVSGGGDGQLFLWDWRKGQVLQTVSLREALGAEVTVRGIWDISVEGLNFIIVGLEGSPKLLCYSIVDNQLKTENTTTQLSGNLLDVAVSDALNSVIISVDTIREVGSTSQWKATADLPQRLLEAFKVTRGDDGLEFVPAEDSIISSVNSLGTSA